MKRKIAFCFFLANISITVVSEAKPLSGTALLARCYAHVTGKPLPFNSPYRAQVKSGAATAISICEQLLDKTSLVGNGFLANPADPEARAVLKNFNNFHRTWFPGNTVEGIQEYSLETSRGTMDIYDSTEPGLSVTRAAFADGARYSDVLTLPSGVIGLREEDAARRARIGWSVDFPGRRIYGNDQMANQNLFHFSGYAPPFEIDSDKGNSLFATLPKIQVGELIGVRMVTSENAMIPNVSLYPLGLNTPGNTVPSLNFSFNLYQSLGGGVMGSPIYMMLNFGHGKGTYSNGSTKVPRRWAQTNMTSFMCATLPALRESDVIQFLVGTSTAPFRNSASCIRCHANLDQMAYTARNVITVGSDYTEFTTGSRAHAKGAILMTTFKPDAGVVTGWPSEPVENFYRSVPTGKLYFRSFSSGELVNVPVSNMSELGLAMASHDDYYQCAAKRYFSFFTGINISLYDRRDPANAGLNKTQTASDLKDRAYIEALATELKSTQSVKLMMKRIMNSEYYKSDNYRP